MKYNVANGNQICPGSDAVEIAHVFKLREGVELFPVEGLRIFTRPLTEAPFANEISGRTEVEDGKARARCWPGGSLFSERTVGLPSRSSCAPSVPCGRSGFNQIPH